MTKITVCIGSACHLKGSRQVVEELQSLIAAHQLQDKIDLGGTFCLGKCQQEGVSVTVDGVYYAVKANGVQKFFNDVIISAVQ